MNKIFLYKTIFGIALLSGLTLLLSCHKSSTNQFLRNTFTWTFDGTFYTANIDSAYLYSITPGGGPLILAGLGTTIASRGEGPGMTVPSFNPGTYSFVPSLYFRLGYVDASGNQYLASSGTVTITANSNFLLSGYFSGTLVNVNNTGGNHTLSGNFTDVPIFR